MSDNLVLSHCVARNKVMNKIKPIVNFSKIHTNPLRRRKASRSLSKTILLSDFVFLAWMFCMPVSTKVPKASLIINAQNQVQRYLLPLLYLFFSPSPPPLNNDFNINQNYLAPLCICRTLLVHTLDFSLPNTRLHYLHFSNT